MPRKALFFFLFFSLSLLAGCDQAARFIGDSGPKDTPTITNTFSVDMWGVAPSTGTISPTPTPKLNLTPLPPTKTPLQASNTPLPETELTPTDTPVPTTPTVSSSAVNRLLFTGSIVPARCVQAAIDQHGSADFLYEDVNSMIADADIAVGTLNASISDISPHTGCVPTFILVGSANNADAMAAAGFDVMSVATNHIKNCNHSNCGDQAFTETLANLRQVGIQPVGGGENLDEALQTVVITANGVRFGFISLGADYGSNVSATTSQSGIANLSDDNLRAAIAAARAVSDVVIFIPHWGADYPTTLNEDQRNFSQIAVDAGVDLIVGNHSHVIQGWHEIEGVPVFYSLGSFVFDQTQRIELRQGLVLQVTFEGTHFSNFEVIPIHIADDKSGKVRVASPIEAAEVLERFQQLSAELD
jgi:poly-gamma-glutamate capsule biosynthesis protein CapA/YwtB (metallophosphatase superfamily)